MALKRILITGAGDGLGKVLRQSLVGSAEVIRLSARRDIGEVAAHEEIQLCDLADAPAVDRLLQGVDAVVHMGGQATEADWDTEYLALEMAVRVVDDLDAALEHIRAHGSGHTEAVVTEDRAAARRFTHEVDAAAVMVNASTRFTDGGEFGFGAEIGISTQKLHARGPMALPELTTTKWVVEGDGQVRA